MGIGDEIMVTGEVRKLALAKPGIRVAVRDARRPDWHRWHVIWNGNPNIAPPRSAYDVVLENAPGQRPYIEAKNMRSWTWKPYHPEPGRIYLDEREASYAQLARKCIVVQPFIKASASPNKRWPIEFWQELIERRPTWNWVQVGDGTEPRLGGVAFIQTPSFRDACGVLSGADMLVSQEGGMHHAAAALGIPAVVIFGGFISPKVTGYASQHSLYVESEQHPLGCGSRTPCFHCHRAMLSIKPNVVIEHMEALFDEHRSR